MSKLRKRVWSTAMAQRDEEVDEAKAPRMIKRCPRGFMMGRQWVRGVTDVVRSLFFPKYVYGEAKRGQERRRPSDCPAPKKTQIGRSRGSRVDREISESLDLMRKYNIEPKWMLEPKVYQKHMVTVAVNAAHRAKLDNLVYHAHEFTKRFWEIMVKNQWIPVRGQGNCASSSARIGTAVDAVVAHKHSPRKHILVEIKCGYYTYLFKHCGMMESPLSMFCDSPLNQFHVQLLCTKLLYERTYVHQKNLKAYVVVLHEHGSDIRALPTEMLGAQVAVWKRLVATRMQTCKDRRKTKRQRTKKSLTPVRRKRSDLELCTRERATERWKSLRHCIPLDKIPVS